MTHNSYPKHNVDPYSKKEKWLRKMVKAAWNDNYHSSAHKMFYSFSTDYDVIRKYAIGEQDPSVYFKAMGVDEQTNTTWMNIDFKILPIIKKYRQIALGRLQKSEYNIVATPIDALARDEADNYYAEVRAKILMRQALEKANPELLNTPALVQQPGEAEDLEELEMQMDFGYKHNLAIEAEQGIQLIFTQNNIHAARKRATEDLFDYGVGIYKDWTDDEGMVRFRNVVPGSFICNFCRNDDFRDMWWAGEVVELSAHDFEIEASGKLTDEQIDEVIGNNRDKKIKILDFECLSTDTLIFDERTDDHGNIFFGESRWVSEEVTNPKYKRKPVQMVYCTKWVIDTDYVYDYGKVNDIKRDRRKLSETELSYHVKALNFYNMQAKGVMEDLIPIADQIQISWMKLQNIRNQLIPYLIEIDLDALEGVALGKGGATMTPYEVLEVAMQKGLLATRRRDQAGNPNYKAVEFVETNYGKAISEAWNDLMNNINLVRDITGFNELTDGSTPNPKTLTTPAKMAYEATNNALYNIEDGEKELLLKLSKASFLRMMRSVKRGKVKGYIRAMGTNTIKFIQVSEDVALHDYGIMLEDKPTPEQKQLLQQNILKAQAEGDLDITDAIIVENTFNLKQAQQILGFKIKKRREQRQKEALQMQEANARTQIASAQAAEEEKRKTLRETWALKKDFMEREKELELILKDRELGIKDNMNRENNDTKERNKKRDLGEPVEEVATA